MPRRSLRPELNRIRAWVQQGRTDAWIAHQLEVTVQQIQSFKREQSLAPGDGEAGSAASEFGEEIDLRAEDDALIAAELEAAAAAAAEAAAAEQAAAEDEDDQGEDDDGERPARRRRSRRGGRRGRGKGSVPLEATFDHGEEGYGLWLDPAVADDPVYAEYWAGHRPVVVTLEEEQIVIRRAGSENGDEDA